MISKPNPDIKPNIIPMKSKAYPKISAPKLNPALFKQSQGKVYTYNNNNIVNIYVNNHKSIKSFEKVLLKK